MLQVPWGLQKVNDVRLNTPTSHPPSALRKRSHWIVTGINHGLGESSEWRSCWRYSGSIPRSQNQQNGLSRSQQPSSWKSDLSDERGPTTKRWVRVKILQPEGQQKLKDITLPFWLSLRKPSTVKSWSGLWSKNYALDDRKPTNLAHFRGPGCTWRL